MYFINQSTWTNWCRLLWNGAWPTPPTKMPVTQTQASLHPWCQLTKWPRVKQLQSTDLDSFRIIGFQMQACAICLFGKGFPWGQLTTAYIFCKTKKAIFCSLQIITSHCQTATQYFFTKCNKNRCWNVYILRINTFIVLQYFPVILEIRENYV